MTEKPEPRFRRLIVGNKKPELISMFCVTNEFKQYRKKPLVVQAKQMPEPFTVDTLEGTMSGKAGDFLIIGIKGEAYPCDKDIFESSYDEATSKAKCQSCKSKDAEIERFRTFLKRLEKEISKLNHYYAFKPIPERYVTEKTYTLHKKIQKELAKQEAEK